MKIDVLHSQGAAAHSVCRLSFLLFIACSQSQLVHIRTEGFSVANKNMHHSLGNILASLPKTITIFYNHDQVIYTVQVIVYLFLVSEFQLVGGQCSSLL